MKPIKQSIRLILIALAIVIFCVSIALNLYFMRGGENITKYHIAAAEKIVGLQFSSSERQLMMENLQQNLARYQKIHEHPLDNMVAPAILFSPFVPGVLLNPQLGSFEITEPENLPLRPEINSLAFAPIPVLAHYIRTRQITSVQLTEMYLRRLKKFGPRLECTITLTEELALEQARRADQEIAMGKYRGLLHGIPWGAKDLLATKGIKTTWGATPYQHQIIDEDATVVKKLEDAGAILVAKLTLGALAMGDVWFGGKTRNPWDINKGSSGSSAGPAAAVSAGLVPFAIGSETWGSIVSPSTVCGVTGLRPTFGRVSRYGAMALSWTMDKLGPIGRNAEDCAIVMNAILGPDGKDLTVYDIPFNFDPHFNLKNYRIGYLKNDFDSDYPFKKTDSLALETIKKMGINLIPIELPDLPVSSLSIILSAEAAAAFDELTRSNRDDLLTRQDRGAWPNLFRSSRFIPAVEYINANRMRTVLMQKMEEIFRQVDIYIAPSWKGNNLLLTNLTGHPAVVLPNGFSAEGTPTSLCIVGKLFEEGKILSFAKAFQEATDFHQRKPNIDEISEQSFEIN
ncbi:MAG TPA: amidase [bacterium]|nr:amidase [bacterium]